MNGERRVRLSERPEDGLSERSESRRTVNEKRLHDRRERPRPGGVIPLAIVDLQLNELRDSVIILSDNHSDNRGRHQ